MAQPSAASSNQNIPDNPSAVASASIVALPDIPGGYLQQAGCARRRRRQFSVDRACPRGLQFLRPALSQHARSARPRHAGRPATMGEAPESQGERQRHAGADPSRRPRRTLTLPEPAPQPDFCHAPYPPWIVTFLTITFQNQAPNSISTATQKYWTAKTRPISGPLSFPR